jgi:hypothetical protein
MQTEIPIYDGFDELDAIGPFRGAQRDAAGTRHARAAAQLSAPARSMSTPWA